MEISGNSGRWGDAPALIKNKVKQELCRHSSTLSKQDREIFLAIAQFESGLNPNAKAATTSASGIFQIVKNTAKGLGLSWQNVFNVKDNINAALKLFKENIRYATVPKHGIERAVMLYALHHDGPSLGYGGVELARKKFIPLLEKVRNENWCVY